MFRYATVLTAFILPIFGAVAEDRAKLTSKVTNPEFAPTAVLASSAGWCIKGQAVSVLYAGQWYPARVLEGPDNLGTCRVSYDGYGSNWDEWVSPKRIRPATSKPAPTTAPASSTVPVPSQAPAASGTVTPGKYSCYTFDAGQLNYAYTDVLIHDAKRYSVGNKSGNYRLGSDGSMRFTGTLSNATGKYAVKRSGKPQIDLIFNGDPRASMACPKG